MAKGNESTEPVSQREILTRRVIDAPPELVWQAWTDPARITLWWGPRGFSTTTRSMELRPGGMWLFTMHGPDGTDYPNRIVFKEVEPGKKLTYAQDDGQEPSADSIHFQTEVLFENLQGKTLLTLRLVFPSAAAKQRVIDEYGAVQGGVDTVSRLAEHLAGQAAPGLVLTLSDDKTIEFHREIAAPRKLVFEAMTQPQHVRQWWGCTQDMRMTACEMDVRVGGQWRITLENASNGERYPFKGEYRAIRPPEYIEQTCIFDVDGIRDFPSIESVTLMQANGKTVIRGRVIHGSQQARDAHLDSGMEHGMAASYDRLEQLLTSGR